MPDDETIEQDAVERARHAGHVLSSPDPYWQSYTETWGEESVDVLWCQACGLPLAVDIRDWRFALCADAPCAGHRDK